MEERTTADQTELIVVSKMIDLNLIMSMKESIVLDRIPCAAEKNNTEILTCHLQRDLLIFF